jgi:hypothetical protein
MRLKEAEDRFLIVINGDVLQARHRDLTGRIRKGKQSFLS